MLSLFRSLRSLQPDSSCWWKTKNVGFIERAINNDCWLQSAYRQKMEWQTKLLTFYLTYYVGFARVLFRHDTHTQIHIHSEWNFESVKCKRLHHFLVSFTSDHGHLVESTRFCLLHGMFHRIVTFEYNVFSSDVVKVTLGLLVARASWEWPDKNMI